MRRPFDIGLAEPHAPRPAACGYRAAEERASVAEPRVKALEEEVAQLKWEAETQSLQRQVLSRLFAAE